jgi:hypothetical protein
VTFRSLLRWGDLDDARRRAARPALLRSPWIAPIVAGAALAAWIGWRAGVDPREASRAWIAAVIVVFCAVMIGAPARLYWRHDSVLLSRLPIPGDAQLAVALVRSARVTAHALVVCAPALAFFARLSTDAALRMAAWLGAIACASALLLPAAALAGGVLVAAPRAVATAMRKLGAPAPVRRTEMLGAIPGFAMSAVVITAIVCVPWLDGRGETAFGPGWVVVGAVAGASIAAAVAALRASARVLPCALREVVALDRQQLAHLEIHPPTALERAAERLLGPRARLVHDKDARLVRRRYPLAFVAGALGTLTSWILAAARPDALVPWATAVAAAMALYAAALARRLGRPPIERAVTLASLPIAPADARAAKRAWYATWLAVYVGPGAIAVVARARDPLAAAGALAGVVAISIVLGNRALAAEED